MGCRRSLLTGDVSSIAVVDGDTLSPLRPTLSYTGEVEITTEDGVLTTRTVGVFENDDRFHEVGTLGLVQRVGHRGPIRVGSFGHTCGPEIFAGIRSVWHAHRCRS